MKLTDVIRRPLITEKTTVIREDGRTLVFQVARDANKIDIKKAVESLLGSKVESVRTSLAHGKFKRQGKYVGRRSDWKKAYVKLRDGEKLPDFLQGAYQSMATRKYTPPSPGVRAKTSLTFDEITTNEPHRPLTENLHTTGG